MEKIRVVIIEDEFAIAEDIKTYLEKNDYHVQAIFDSAECALPFIQTELPDVLLIDIKLSGVMSGIDLVKQIRSQINIPVIYITANSDHATFEKAKATHPHAFLVKPFTSINLLASIELALYNFLNEISPEKIERVMQAEPQKSVVINHTLFVKSNGRFKKVSSNDILFVEASGSYVHIQTAGQRFTLTQNLAHFQRKTPLPFLLKIHRSFIVNMNKVDSFDDAHVFIENHKIPISENHRKEFLDKIHCL